MGKQALWNFLFSVCTGTLSWGWNVKGKLPGHLKLKGHGEIDCQKPCPDNEAPQIKQEEGKLGRYLFLA